MKSAENDNIAARYAPKLEEKSLSSKLKHVDDNSVIIRISVTDTGHGISKVSIDTLERYLLIYVYIVYDGIKIIESV